ncbi:uncharacterized protein LOC116604754 [Nematostella vectensis]|uniref:uncharacterized protein LOC116604754 n=1 Tax=Nematostella vectensis TaxID=45351 RepID=UPI00207766E3|nr:uncharacterized protein LOC116604754 [Nematostella vectensis]XP_048582204.1 uncharacterized protein LOC116604754 [Nematostella vectensis]
MFSLKKPSPAKVSFILLVMAYIHGDIGSFYRASQTWRVPKKLDDKSVSFLFLGDPQVLGYIGEGSTFLASIVRWDSDRYIKKSFNAALKHVQPDAIVVLGDAFNEGFTATDEEFCDTKRRFDWIFESAKDLPFIVLAGDNDIGGEDFDVMSKSVVSRFIRHFGPLNGVVNIGSVQLVKVNTASFIRYTPFTNTEKKAKNDTYNFIEKELPMLLKETTKKIILAHAPLPHLPKPLYTKLLQIVEPKGAVSGHLHMNLEVFHKVQRYPPMHFWEHVMPTCSYRMGTKNMGIGVGIIDTDLRGQFRVSVLKLPERYCYLITYAILSSLTLLLFLLSFKRVRRTTYSLIYRSCSYILAKSLSLFDRIDQQIWMFLLNAILGLIFISLCMSSVLIVKHYSSKNEPKAQKPNFRIVV